MWNDESERLVSQSTINNPKDCVDGDERESEGGGEKDEGYEKSLFIHFRSSATPPNLFFTP